MDRQELTRVVREAAAEAMAVDPAKVGDDANLHDLGAQSLEFLDIVFRLEQEYGIEITRENLARVERGEELLHSLGFAIVRVRHFGETAKVEVPLADLPRLLEAGLREQVVTGLKAVGYRFVTVDLEGFRSGNLNRLLAGGEAHPRVQEI